MKLRELSSYTTNKLREIDTSKERLRHAHSARRR
jgi:hypothetical protein